MSSPVSAPVDQAAHGIAGPSVDPYLHSMVRGFTAAGLCVLLVGSPVGAFEGGHHQVSVYSVEPWIDGPLIAAGTLAVVIPYAYASLLITPRCPCDPAEVNAFDRHVIGNSNAFLDSTSE